MQTLMLYISFQVTFPVSWLYKVACKKNVLEKSGAFFFYSSYELT
nr:MAG TPA: hypothetical protein [Caudoviricetes sp.]